MWLSSRSSYKVKKAVRSHHDGLFLHHPPFPGEVPTKSDSSPLVDFTFYDLWAGLNPPSGSACFRRTILDAPGHVEDALT